MTNEEARAIMTALKQSYINFRTKSDLKKKTVKENIKAYDMAIKALETIPKYKDAYNKGWDDGAKATYEHLKMCEEEQGGDLISRDAVIEQTYLWSKDEFLRITNPFDYLRKRIKNLPPVNPQEPKTGQYEKHIDHTDCIWYGSDSGCPVT